MKNYIKLKLANGATSICETLVGPSRNILDAHLQKRDAFGKREVTCLNERKHRKQERLSSRIVKIDYPLSLVLS